MDPAVGRRIRVRVDAVANGGHCVARHEGRVVFVRHALPGEVVDAVVTGTGGGGRWWRADAVDVVTASPDRRPSPCPVSGPGGCGGCDWQHVTPTAQRRLKAEVVRDVLARIGGVDRALLDGLEVAEVDGDRDGLAWRTRVTYAVTDDGRAGLRRHRSHDVVTPDRCLLATDAVAALDVTGRRWPGCTQVTAVVSGEGDRAVVVEPAPASSSAFGGMPGEVSGVVSGGRGRRAGAPAWASSVDDGVAVPGWRGPQRVHERVAGHGFVVDAAGFWQVHPGAATTLAEAVRQALRPRPGERVLDLYAGVGLFAVLLADDVGPAGRVDAVEGDERAVAAARRNAHGLDRLRLHHADVERWLPVSGGGFDVVVLDPPRAGAGRRVVAGVAASGARAVAYVACDPAALARDLAAFAGHGWRLAGLRAFDLFPTTHHVECVALLLPDG